METPHTDIQASERTSKIFFSLAQQLEGNTPAFHAFNQQKWTKDSFCTEHDEYAPQIRQSFNNSAKVEPLHAAAQRNPLSLNTLLALGFLSPDDRREINKTPQSMYPSGVLNKDIRALTKDDVNELASLFHSYTPPLLFSIAVILDELNQHSVPAPKSAAPQAKQLRPVSPPFVPSKLVPA